MPTFTGSIAEDTIPQEVTNPLPANLTAQSLSIRLQETGTVRFIDGGTEIVGGGFSADLIRIWVIDTFELKNSKIITNGNTLVIICNKLIADGASIVAFDANHRKAASGAAHVGKNGEPGKPGDSGGLVSIHVIQSMEGRLDVDLSGQEGGNGLDGIAGDPGGPGTPGTPCDAGFSGWPVPHPICHADGGPGGKGGTGGPGGHGGQGGNGGKGGSFLLYNVGDNSIPQAAYSFKADGGGAGQSGRGGSGGQGGDGGSGGDGNWVCHGGPVGPRGDTGTEGNSPGNGVQGPPGLKIIQNLDLQAFIGGIPRAE